MYIYLKNRVYVCIQAAGYSGRREHPTRAGGLAAEEGLRRHEVRQRRGVQSPQKSPY